MVMHENTAKENFERTFFFTARYKGQTVNSIDDLATFLEKDYPKRFFDYKMIPQESYDLHQVEEPFSYITARLGSKEINNFEVLGFKLDSEPFIRVGPPYLEEGRVQACFGHLDGYRLYESPEKKHHILTHSEL